MSLQSLADNALIEINEILPLEMSEDETAAIRKIIENTLLEAVAQASRSCREAAVICCGPEADIAHKIANEVKLAQKALIANLMGPR